MKHQILIAVYLGLLSAMMTAEARMYQWRHPQSGTIQLSGTPPAWYRSGAPGPRVFVFDDGQLVDDTAVAVSDTQRAVLRERALGAAAVPAVPQGSSTEGDRHALREALESAAREGVDIDALASQANEAARADEQGPTSIADTVAELKALLETWDRIRETEARSVIEEAQVEIP